MNREPQRRSAPSRAQLINLLIEERAKVIAWSTAYHEEPEVTDDIRSAARREIEAEVLKS